MCFVFNYLYQNFFINFEWKGTFYYLMYAQSTCHVMIFKGTALIKDILLVSAIINAKEKWLFDGTIHVQCLLTGTCCRLWELFNSIIFYWSKIKLMKLYCETLQHFKDGGIITGFLRTLKLHIHPLCIKYENCCMFIIIKSYCTILHCKCFLLEFHFGNIVYSKTWLGFRLQAQWTA
jgi:hypothetical protein